MCRVPVQRKLATCVPAEGTVKRVPGARDIRSLVMFYVRKEGKKERAPEEAISLSQEQQP